LTFLPGIESLAYRPDEFFTKQRSRTLIHSASKAFVVGKLRSLEKRKIWLTTDH
jgi:hypothetical protein